MCLYLFRVEIIFWIYCVSYVIKIMSQISFLPFYVAVKKMLISYVVDINFQQGSCDFSLGISTIPLPALAPSSC